jgi:hypothetical protein
MEPDDTAQTLDTLLDTRIAGVHPPSDEPDADLDPLLDVAELIAAGREIAPFADFATSLKARFLDAAEAARSEQTTSVLSTPTAEQSHPKEGKREKKRFVGRLIHSRRIQVAALAATLLIALGGALLYAAGAASPASPLYTIRRAEQTIRAQVATSTPDAVDLHVTYADQALTALTEAAQKHDVERYRAALTTLVEEDSAAVAAANAEPAGDQRTQSKAQVAQLRAQEVAGLRMALPALGWHDRITTTSALVGIGDKALSVTTAAVGKAATGKGNQHLWQVTISGSGFQLGAILLINEVQRGVVISVSDSLLVAQVDDGPIQGNASLGVGNPDATAANAQNITHNDISDTSQSTPVATPTKTHGKGGL